MMPHHLYSQLAVLGLLGLWVLLHLAWSSSGPTPQTKPSRPITPRRTRSHAPPPLAGLTHTPPCALCAREPLHPQAPPPRPPDPIPPTPRRPRAVDPSQPCCPHASCDDRGGLGRGQLRAHGPPRGGPWRPFHCPSCQGYCLETPGTLFHGTQAAVERLVPGLACLAEGVGGRATARGFEGTPTTVRPWRVEAAAQLRAFSAYFLGARPLAQLQLDALYAGLRAFRAGEISDAEAIKRLERSPYGGWTAMDPTSKWRVVGEGGCRTLAMAPHVVQHVAHGVAPDGGPLLLTDGRKDYATAILRPWGHGRHPERRQDQGPRPTPRWRPRPELLSAHVVKS
jgi:hypothetical protein